MTASLADVTDCMCLFNLQMTASVSEVSQSLTGWHMQIGAGAIMAHEETNTWLGSEQIDMLHQGRFQSQWPNSMYAHARKSWPPIRAKFVVTTNPVPYADTCSQPTTANASVTAAQPHTQPALLPLPALLLLPSWLPSWLLSWHACPASSPHAWPSKPLAAAPAAQHDPHLHNTRHTHIHHAISPRLIHAVVEVQSTQHVSSPATARAPGKQALVFTV